MSESPRNGRKFDETVQRGAEEVARIRGEQLPLYASVKDTVAQSKEWTDNQLVCRTKGHRFTVPLVAQHYTRYRYFYIEVECEGGCGVVQVREMNERGHVYWSSLRYPNGYLSRNGRIAGDSRDALNVELLYRVFKPRKSNTAKAEPHHGWDDAVDNGKAANE